MKLYNTTPKLKYKALGFVSGSIIKSRFILRDFLAGIRKILGKEITEYTDLMKEVRTTAFQRMEEEAKELGGNAIINIRITSTQITNEAAEIYVYGTAVIIEEEKNEPS